MIKRTPKYPTVTKPTLAERQAKKRQAVAALFERREAARKAKS
jgi:hypothetical protein